MSLFAKSTNTPVATVEVAFLGGNRAKVTAWVDETDRQEAGYHAILHYLMYYSRLLFFLSYRPTGDVLVGWMDDAIRALTEAEGAEQVGVTRDWEIVSDSDEEPRVVWASSLTLVGPAKYKCIEQRPKDPEDADAQAVALLHLQTLVNTLPALERAYLTLGIVGMHEYYREIQHWGNSKSLHPAPAYGISHARRILEKRA